MKLVYFSLWHWILNLFGRTENDSFTINIVLYCKCSTPFCRHLICKDRQIQCDAGTGQEQVLANMQSVGKCLLSAKQISVGKSVINSHTSTVGKANKYRQRFSRRLLPRMF
jgi:hypothetical protein